MYRFFPLSFSVPPSLITIYIHVHTRFTKTPFLSPVPCSDLGAYGVPSFLCRASILISAPACSQTTYFLFILQEFSYSFCHFSWYFMYRSLPPIHTLTTFHLFYRAFFLSLYYFCRHFIYRSFSLSLFFPPYLISIFIYIHTYSINPRFLPRCLMFQRGYVWCTILFSVGLDIHIYVIIFTSPAFYAVISGIGF